VTTPRPLEAVARVFERAGLRYALIGAHAVNAWLEPRITADIDVTVQLSAAELARLEHAFAAAGLGLARSDGAELPSGPDFLRFVSSDRRLVVEIQAAKTEFQQQVLARAVTVESGVKIATPEDLIVLKLIANRAKDRVDILGLLRLPNLDWDYIERCSREWETDALLRELRAQAPIR
jgi:hypothetical protein